MRGLWPPAASTRVSPGFSSKAPDRPIAPAGRARDWAIAALGLLIAFWLGFTYAANNSLQHDWAQTRFSAAVNYACTGRFGPVRLTSEATDADHAALDTLNAFLEVRRLDFPCASFPQHVAPTTLVDGIDVANAEQPLYLMLVYGLAWRSFGVHWAVTYYVVAAIAAISFVVLYLCLRPFVPALVAVAAALLFLSSPFFITNALSPRDALKFPFAVGIAALLIGRGTAPRRPARFIGFAALIGLLIGIGYGFRSDILFLLVPAVLISAAVAAIDLPIRRTVSGKAPRRRGLGVRLAAAAAVLAAFVVGAGAPLVNDHVLNDNHGNVGYGPLAMGLLGHTRHDLYQGHSLVDGMYMFRNSYNNDLSVGVRVMEFAARQSGEQIDHGVGRYWTYAKRYYLQVASLIPADLVAGGIGAFVNLMTVPRSLVERNSQAWRYDRAAPWRTAYAFVGDSAPYARLLRAVDAAYAAAMGPSADAWFAANLVVLFLFLWLIAWRFGV